MSNPLEGISATAILDNALAQPDGTVVGTTRDNECCLIAAYVRRTHPEVGRVKVYPYTNPTIEALDGSFAYDLTRDQDILAGCFDDLDITGHCHLDITVETLRGHEAELRAAITEAE